MKHYFFEIRVYRKGSGGDSENYCKQNVFAYTTVLMQKWSLKVEMDSQELNGKPYGLTGEKLYYSNFIEPFRTGPLKA